MEDLKGMRLDNIALVGNRSPIRLGGQAFQ